MSKLARKVIDSIDRIGALVPEGVSAFDYVRQMLEEQLDASSEEELSMGRVMLPFGRAYERRSAIASALRTVELFETPHKLVERPEGIVDLGLIEWILRPSLLLREGVFCCPDSGPWSHLKSDQMSRVAQSVCRIDVSIGKTNRMHLGTGVAVGFDSRHRLAILTNAHVVEEAQQRLGWPSNQQIEIGCDFRCEADSDGALSNLSRDCVRHAKYDLALVFLEASTDSDFPAVLPVANGSPDPTVGLAIGVIGHPSFDSNVDSFPKLFGFGEHLGVKRFSPGFIRTVSSRIWRTQEVEIILHDATTLSGSSGSCLVDLRSNVLVGLHFGGWPLTFGQRSGYDNNWAALFEANGAVPLWIVEKEEFLRTINVAA